MKNIKYTNGTMGREIEGELMIQIDKANEATNNGRVTPTQEQIDAAIKLTHSNIETSQLLADNGIKGVLSRELHINTLEAHKTILAALEAYSPLMRTQLTPSPAAASKPSSGSRL